MQSLYIKETVFHFLEELYFMCIRTCTICMCTTCVLDACGCLKGASDHLELVMSHHVGAYELNAGLQ